MHIITLHFYSTLHTNVIRGVLLFRITVWAVTKSISFVGTVPYVLNKRCRLFATLSVKWKNTQCGLLLPEFCHYVRRLQQAAVWTSIFRSSVRVTWAHCTTHAKWPEPHVIAADHCSSTKWKVIHVPDIIKKETIIGKGSFTAFSRKWCVERSWTGWLWCRDCKVPQQSRIYKLDSCAVGLRYLFLFPNTDIPQFIHQCFLCEIWGSYSSEY